MNHYPVKFLLALGLLALWLAGCGDRETASFAADVRPVLDQYCMECHKVGGEGHEASGFSMVSYADVMKGTDNGPMVIAGDSLGSNLIVLMEGRADPSIYMPKGSHGDISQAKIDKIKAWIDEGAKDN
jgi:hypothetical protein